MSAPFMPAKSFRKRKSLRDQLDRVQTLDDDTQARERYELLVELEEDLAQAKNFRWHAPASQKRQGKTFRSATRQHNDLMLTDSSEHRSCNNQCKGTVCFSEF